MSFQVGKWVKKYKQLRPNEEIVYTGQNGDYPSDKYEFSSISTYAQQQNHLKDSDISRIIDWIGHGNSLNHFEENYGNNKDWATGEPQNLTKDILTSGLAGKAAIDKLQELPGVKVQIASALMTVMDSQNHAIVSVERFRSLPVAAPNLNISNDDERILWLSALEKFNDHSDVYDYYLGHVDDIVSTTGATAREVDMALWSYDADNRIQTF